MDPGRPGFPYIDGPQKTGHPVLMQATLESRLEATKSQDPRPQYRELLRLLKERDPAQFDVLRQHYAREVEEALAKQDRDPLGLWLDYGLVLAEAMVGPGTAMEINDAGVAIPLEGSPKPGSLTLFLPEGRGSRALAVAVPATPTLAQEATLDLLVHGKVKFQPRDEPSSAA